MLTLKTGISLASTAAIVAMASAVPTAPAFAKDAQVHCYGTNTCKGTSDCKTAANECKGQNECKGMGFKAMSAKQCKTAGGSLTEAK